MPKTQTTPLQSTMQWEEYVLRENRDRAKPNSRGFKYNTWLTDEQLKESINYFDNSNNSIVKKESTAKWVYGPVGKICHSLGSTTNAVASVPQSQEVELGIKFVSEEKREQEQQEESQSQSKPKSSKKSNQVKDCGYDRQFHYLNDYEQKLHRCDRASKLGLDIGKEEASKAVPCLASSVYGAGANVEVAERTHRRIESVYKGFFRPRGTGIPLGGNVDKLMNQ